MKALQDTLNYAINRRDDEWKSYDYLVRSDKPHLGMLDNQHHQYREAQAFLEGVTMAIFAAGYGIEKDSETGKQTVCKL